ncbi:MAG: type I restriction endonuclease subunit R [Treponema sp.]|jgi:type I restriction enzyme R subunit|nr:type I restriction endonuclease subunit R [Treponema sp.]
MAKINECERTTQDRVVRFFQKKLNYDYYGNLHSQINTNIIIEKLTEYLTERGYSASLSKKTIDDLVSVASNLQQGLYKANQDVYTLLKYGTKIKENPGEPDKTVYFIDWEYPEKNKFAIAEEVTIKDKSERRPDLVVYINGIAIAVIELKRSTVSVSEGIRQNLSNQSEYFNKPFFTTIQYVMAGNNSEGLRYGAIETKEKYYMEWKNDTVNTSAQPLDEVSLDILEKCSQFSDKLDWQIYSMFHKWRLLDLIHNFIIFDKGDKKVCRYNQYFGIKKTQMRISKKQGGIIWHTQGSGKTLTMVWLSKWILANNSNARVLIITDREELDEQAEKVYKGVDEKVYRTKSCTDLVEKLDNTDKRLICTLIHKFGVHSNEENSETKPKKSVEQFIKELKDSLPQNFKAKGDIIVFVDECHRTQSGLLHEGMKTILPNAIFIGFTGTPLLVKDKKTSIEIFGGYIHTYKYDEGVTDGIIIDLRYEARDIDQTITSQEKIDEYFAAKTRGLNDTAKAKLKSKWGTMQTMYSSRKRLEVIAEDIIYDFDVKGRLADGNGNALLVADSIYSACKYYEIFQSKGFKKCAIITSFVPLESNLRTESENSEEFEKYEIYKKMLGDQSVEDFEKEAKRKFIEEPANMMLLIVVDKLLTGFDAPPCTYLYIDKSMQDHGLFQAICRVNRLDEENKDFGYIVDYKQLFGSLTDALKKYTAGAFEGYDSEDIKGMIKDRLSEAKKYLDDTLEELDDLCGGVKSPKARIDYIHYFCGENGVGGIDEEACSRSREKLYKLVNRLIRAYAEIKGDMGDAGYTISEQAKIEKDVTSYIGLKKEIGHTSGDFIDLKSYEADMRRLIDNYIKAEDSRTLGEFDNLTLLDFVMIQGEKLAGKNKEAAAEAIENNIRKKIVEKILINPKYYEQMSAILDELIKLRREGAAEYESFLEKCIDLVKKTENPETYSSYPENIRHSCALRAFYDNCGENEDLAITLDQAVRENMLDGFRHNEFKERRIKRALFTILKDHDEVDRIFNIIVEQKEY